jgi:methyl coenzyme M reductase alpha subunit
MESINHALPGGCRLVQEHMVEFTLVSLVTVTPNYFTGDDSLADELDSDS